METSETDNFSYEFMVSPKNSLLNVGCSDVFSILLAIFFILVEKNEKKNPSKEIRFRGYFYDKANTKDHTFIYTALRTW